MSIKIKKGFPPFLLVNQLHNTLFIQFLPFYIQSSIFLNLQINISN